MISVCPIRIRGGEFFFQVRCDLIRQTGVRGLLIVSFNHQGRLVDPNLMGYSSSQWGAVDPTVSYSTVTVPLEERDRDDFDRIDPIAIIRLRFGSQRDLSRVCTITAALTRTLGTLTH